jgi:predicted DNA-binding transcriptional regulator YafY
MPESALTLWDTLHDPALEILDQLQDAIRARVAVVIQYQGAVTRREVLPAAVFFWGNAWAPGAICAKMCGCFASTAFWIWIRARGFQRPAPVR